MRYLYLLLFLVCLGCNNKRILELPELENAEITTVLDVSPAYIFYDDTQPDSTLLNRKNLIITTNWLVNVDKRLTLKQAIPHIKFLQDKKRNAEMHKNENAKNYFTCNDTSIGNLGFLEFTDVNYINDIDNYQPDNDMQIDNETRFIMIHFFNSGYLSITEIFNGKDEKQETLEIKKYFNLDLFTEYHKNKNLINISFDKRMSIQKYINIKHKILNFTNEMSEISNDEFIY